MTYFAKVSLCTGHFQKSSYENAFQGKTQMLVFMDRYTSQMTFKHVQIGNTIHGLHVSADCRGLWTGDLSIVYTGGYKQHFIIPGLHPYFTGTTCLCRLSELIPIVITGIV